MEVQTRATLQDVQAVYSGAEGRLWELIMGEQIHIGGLKSSMALADAAAIAPESRGVDLCCCSGAGMRFLLRFRKVAHMTGVDATQAMVELGTSRCASEGLAGQADFVLADACETTLPGQSADFVWGEDAWCYVEDKTQLIREAARVVKPGGVIAFTDWLCAEQIPQDHLERFVSFMKFPNMQTLNGYQELLRSNGCEVLCARNTGLFAPCIALYMQMLTMQLTYDALKIIGFDQELFQALGGEIAFTRELAEAGQIFQGLVVARKTA